VYLVPAIALGVASPSTASQALLLSAFVIVAILAAMVSTGAVSRAWGFLDKSLNTSAQLPVRLTVVLVFGLVVLASSLGLDLILGAFAAGIIALRQRGAQVAEAFPAAAEPDLKPA
jgi:Kef-type K+ transport system membrane component KefB